MSTWENVANYCAEVYGIYVDWDERFFNCPECGEAIYEDDWLPESYETRCPVCDFKWEDE